MTEAYELQESDIVNLCKQAAYAELGVKRKQRFDPQIREAVAEAIGRRLQELLDAEYKQQHT